MLKRPTKTLSLQTLGNTSHYFWSRWRDRHAQELPQKQYPKDTVSTQLEYGHECLIWFKEYWVVLTCLFTNEMFSHGAIEMMPLLICVQNGAVLTYRIVWLSCIEDAMKRTNVFTSINVGRKVIRLKAKLNKNFQFSMHTLKKSPPPPRFWCLWDLKVKLNGCKESRNIQNWFGFFGGILYRMRILPLFFPNYVEIFLANIIIGYI